MTNYTGTVVFWQLYQQAWCMHHEFMIKHRLVTEFSPPSCRNRVQVHKEPNQAGQAPPIAAQALATQHQQSESN